jgi:hypothetical protein
MSFKENLLKKIKINKLAKQVIATIGHPDSDRRVDKNIMRNLLAMSSYTHRRERDLDLYLQDHNGTHKTKILVLDNDLAIYHTTVEDVALRKSPTVKEMISIRNVIKILNDSDVVVSKKEASVQTIRQECIAMLELSFIESDLDEILDDGRASLEKEYSDGIIEALELFAEILAFEPAPPAFLLRHHTIFGAVNLKEGGSIVFGPMVIYSMIHNTLVWIEQQVESSDREKIDFLKRVAEGRQEGTAKGPEVFVYLKQMALNKSSDPG